MFKEGGLGRVMVKVVLIFGVRVRLLGGGWRRKRIGRLVSRIAKVSLSELSHYLRYQKVL